jgi:hypothetical protein
MTFTLNIDMDKKCAECGKGGATDNGICMKCNTKAISGKPMKSAIGRAVQRRYMERIKK